MESAKNQFLSAIKEANNVMVTVKSDPSIDGLAAAIALTLMLNGLNKHATAVFSGTVPSVLEFLEPEKTLEVNTNSLQDFIISLDKTKADKLRYKVEDDVVKVFITPYRTSLSPADLEFSQGDFNVDVVVLLGVHSQAELDAAVSAHGRILHDATVLSVNLGVGDAKGDDLGAINWNAEHVSSLSELIANSAEELLGDKKEVLDNQVATALLTGIVAATDRFGNSLTTPETMQASARLLQAGANQELVATKLSAAPRPAAVESVVEPTTEAPQDGVQDFAEDAGGTPLIQHSMNEEPAQADTPAGMLSLHDDASVDDSSTEAVASAAEIDTPPIPETAETTEVIQPIADLPVEASEALPTSPEVIAPAIPENGISEVHHSDLADAPMLDMAAAAVTDVAEQTRPAYDLNQISVPASVPISEGEQAAIERASTPEEEALMAMLNQGTPATTPQAEGVQPLRDQNVFLGEPPLHEKKMNPQPIGQSASVDSSLDATKFAVTPPQFGGALTAAYDDSEAAPAADPLSAPQSPHIIRHRALMTQDPHGQAAQAAAGSVDVQTDGSPEAADAPHSPGQVTAPSAPDASKPVTMAHEKVLSVPTHDAGETAEPSAGGGETLSELERLIGAQHTDPVAHDGPRQALQAALAAADNGTTGQDQMPPAGGMPSLQPLDMPFPTVPTTDLTMPQFGAPAGSQQSMPAASTPPPVPPPMPMFGGPAA